MNINVISEFLKPLLFIGTLFFIVVVLYGFFENQEYDEEDTITITFRCSDVLSSRNSYPTFVVDECIKLRNHET
jgi:hypothetical protein